MKRRKKKNRINQDHVIYLPRSKFYTEILERLCDDVGPYLDIVRRPNTKNNYFGNFALIRMTMPIIDTIGKAEQREPWSVLKDMKIPLPRLTWSMFRHGLIHNENPIIITWGKREVSWVLSPFGMMIQTHPSTNEVHIDCTELYNRLCTYLENSIQTKDHKRAKQTISVQLINPKIEEQEEFKFFD